VIGEWQYLHGGELSDMPGRCETWQVSVRHLGDDKWQLELSGTDFCGFEEREAEVDTMTTDALVDWALTMDEMEASPRPRRAYRPGCADELPEDDDEVVELGPRASALLRIAELVGAEDCINKIRSRL
jgi:hypothetical protein